MYKEQKGRHVMDNRTKFVDRIVLLFLAVLFGSTTVVLGGMGGGALVHNPDYFYVDGIHGDDNNRGSSPVTAFATIQKAIEASAHGDIILVYPGLYSGQIDFQGKAITVQGVPVSQAGIPVLHNPGDFAVSFFNGEGPASILKNFMIKDSFMAVFVAGSAPTLSNLTIVNNTYGVEAYVYAQPDISNCIFWRNSGGDLFGCQARHSRVSRVGQGQSNITADPLFVDPNSGDYHLSSERGRYWPEHDIWVLGQVTSPCIDGGDPNDHPSNERIPNGGRINMGAYGGTLQASMSPDPLPNRAFNPRPYDGAVEVDLDTTLSWDAGPDTVMHDVCFGTENPPLLVSSQAMSRYDPGQLNSGTVYFWRIDEIDDKGNKTEGNVWKFTTTSRAPVKGRACFVPETKVWVNGALVSISKVRAGCCIGPIKCDGKTIPLPYQGKIERVQEHEGVFECCDIVLESGNRISVAERHYFLTASGKWLAVQNLRTGTRLQTAKGSIAVVNVTRRSLPFAGKVYNLKVDGSDRYLVGKDAIVVRDY